MKWFALVVGMLAIAGVVLDALQTIILPRRPKGRFRLTRLFYILTWAPLTFVASHTRDLRTRERLYSAYGPVSLLLLLGLWASMLVIGFACIYYALGTPFSDSLNQHGRLLADLRTDLYVSGTTLFTLGLGDVTPQRHLARLAVVLESGAGLGFVALVIGYLPVLYQAFSRREVSVAMLDGRAGSPPTATELLRRHGHEGGDRDLALLLSEWERWSAEVLETHISYPILCYYRSQHDNQSWLAGLVCVLDACALLITTVEGPVARQAQLTFAMGRHALLDLGHVFSIDKPLPTDLAHSKPEPDRLPKEVFYRLCGELGGMHMRLCGDPAAQERLTAMRALYEPHAKSLSDYLRMTLPLWVPDPRNNDPWKKVADLRMGAAPTALTELQQHVSDRSTAAHLHDEEHGF